MIAPSLLCIATPYIAAFVIVRWAFLQPTRRFYLDSLLATLGLGIGIGLGSCSFFLWRSLNYSTADLKLGETLFFLLCTAAFVIFMRKKPRIPNHAPIRDDEVRTPASTLTRLSFFLVLICAMVGFVLLSYNRPHGSSDAYAIWNLHARFLSRGSPDWTNCFSPLLDRSHPDYPLLIPATIARFWTYLGTETVLVPAMIGGFFTFASVALLFLSFSVLQLRNQGFLAAMFLLATAPYINLGACQMSDVPIGFFMLSTIIILTVKDQVVIKNNRLMVLAGITCGLAAWTKNEGLLFVAAVLVSRIALYLTRRNIGQHLGEMLFFSFGFVPIITIVLFFKIGFAPANDLVTAHTLNLVIPRLLDIPRHLLIGKWFLREMTHFGNGVTALLFVYLALVGLRLNERMAKTAISGGTLLVTMLLGYFCIYVLTPHNLVWHLASSLQRLLVQLWPTLLFMAFFIARPLFDRESEKDATDSA